MEIDQLRHGYAVEGLLGDEVNASGVSWAAVTAGAVTTAALWLILLSLGAGLGLSAISVWSAAGMSTRLGAPAIIWLILAQALSASMGGYLAGRLRTKWAGIHNDEVYFRDTAHGFLAWSLALVATAAFLSAASVAMVGAKVSSPETSEKIDPANYYVDQLFRSDQPRAVPDAIHAEAANIFANGIRKRGLPAADQSYLARIAAVASGLSDSNAETRVSDTFARAQKAADDARKTVAYSLLWGFISLLIGAFCASCTATVGGRQRDHVRGPAAAR